MGLLEAIFGPGSPQTRVKTTDGIDAIDVKRCPYNSMDDGEGEGRMFEHGWNAN